MQPVPYSYVAWSLLPLNKGSGSRNHRAGHPHLASRPPASPPCRLVPQALWAPTHPSSFPKLPGTWNLHKEVPSTRDHLWYNKRERLHTEGWAAQRTLQELRNYRGQRASLRSTSKGWAGPLSRCSWLSTRSPEAHPPIKGSHQDPLSHLQAPVPSTQRCSSWSHHLLPPTSLQLHLAHRPQRASFCMGYFPEAGRDSSLV